MITKSTKRQWAEIEALRQREVAGITEQPSDDAVRETVRVMWKRMGVEPKAVLIADCPIVGALFFCWLGKVSQLDAQLGD
jgi:hypothetical protein